MSIILIIFLIFFFWFAAIYITALKSSTNKVRQDITESTALDLVTVSNPALKNRNPLSGHPYSALHTQHREVKGMLGLKFNRLIQSSSPESAGKGGRVG